MSVSDKANEMGHQITLQGSKPIGKSDDSSKEFIIDCLKGDKTYGFDIDSIYHLCNDEMDRYFVFEYLKCESENVTPHRSEPKYYPYNWRKFHSLYQLAKRLGGKLILVNYGDGYKVVKDEQGNMSLEALPNQEKYQNEVRVFTVSHINYDILKTYVETPYEQKPKHLDYLVYTKDEKITVEQFSERLRKLNKLCGNGVMNWEKWIE